MRQFDALRHTMRMREEYSHTEMIGELLLPAGEMLRQQGLGQKYSKYFEAFFRAGVEVVRNPSLRECLPFMKELPTTPL